MADARRIMVIGNGGIAMELVCVAMCVSVTWKSHDPLSALQCMGLSHYNHMIYSMCIVLDNV